MSATASWDRANSPDAPWGGLCDRRGPYHEFSRRVRLRHHLVEHTVLCSCGLEAFLCPDLHDAHELFGDQVPWAPVDLLPLRPPEPPRRSDRHPLPHPVAFKAPRPHRGEL